MIEPDLLYSVLCDEVRREDNGKWILIGLFEHIAAPHFPWKHPMLCVMNKWCNGAGQWMQQTRIVDEDDNVLSACESVPLDLPNLDSWQVTVQMFQNLVIPHAGKIWVEVLINNELKQRYAIHLELVQEKK